MSKKWTEAQPGEQAIVDLKEFNHGYNAYKSSFNGDLDRTTLPNDILDEDSVVGGAFHQVQITNSADLDNHTDGATGTGGQWRGPSYATYNGGWVLADEVTVTKYKDGMCHWEYSFIFFNFIVNTGQGSIKYMEIKLTWDENTVFESYKITQPIQSTRLIADFPTTGGTHTARVYVRAAPRGLVAKDGVGDNIFNIVAPSHLFIGRWR